MPTPEQILSFLKKRAGEVFTPSELMEELRVPVREKREVKIVR